jgi:O-antigen ligase
LNSRATKADVGTIRPGDSAAKFRVASILGTTVFISLLCLIVLTAIPYGTSEPWWMAAFVAAAFALAILWLIEGFISQSWFAGSLPLVLPLAAFTLFSFLQTLPFGNQSGNPGALRFAPWYAISADPYQTRFFALLLAALTLSGVLLARYATSEKRMRTLMNLIICVAAISALFGILRQTTQHGPGFGLPNLIPEAGYGQFINYNHFAYLMEMALGLILGLVLGGGVKREQALIYVAALLPIWIGLVLCGSRGGLIGMLAQLIITALLFGMVARKGKSSESQSRILRSASSAPVRVTLILVLILGVVFGTIWLGGDRLALKIEALHTEFTPETSDSRLGVNRNEIWKATWQMFRAHPVLGVGMAAYWAAIPAFHDAAGTMTPQEAHNDYLELLASGGLVGLALGIWFAAVVCKRIGENLSAPNRFRRAACFGAAIGIAGVAVHSLVDFGLHTIVNALVFTTLIVIATSKPQWGNDPKRSYDQTASS